MIIREATINDTDRWNEFVKAQASGSFTQSFDWANFFATHKERVWRFIVEDDTRILGVIFFFRSYLKFNQTILYAPKGPIIADNIADFRSAVFKLLVEKIDQVAKEEGALYFQCDPQTRDNSWLELLANNGFTKSARDIQPRHTLILDIRPSIEELQKNMHPKTRYNIRLAEKKGVEIIIDNSKHKEFLELLKKTEQRQKISLYGSDYFKNILQLPFVKLYLAKYNGKYIAANIIIFWNHEATYLFGASDYTFRQIMAPHLLQWQAIKDARRDGYWFYDFWGAAPKNASGREQNWGGFTKFKMGFSPDAEITEYLGTYEKVYNNVATGIYRFLQQIFH
jgi:lipid II:glycine glycyltransferase (peptidoglycan interpeptide bridge formation enzyme)